MSLPPAMKPQKLTAAQRQPPPQGPGARWGQDESQTRLSPQPHPCTGIMVHLYSRDCRSED